MGKRKVRRPTAQKHPRAKRPAIFLDRDGTLIRQKNDIVHPAAMKPMRGVPEALAIFRRLGFLLIVITNQPVISKGLIDMKGVERLHTTFNNHLRRHRANIDAFYICPHRSWHDCMCRKPQIGSVTRALKKYRIDSRRSFFIGDSLRDVATGRKAGMTTILLKTGIHGKDNDLFPGEPDHVARNLLAAAKLIVTLRLASLHSRVPAALVHGKSEGTRGTRRRK